MNTEGMTSYVTIAELREHIERLEGMGANEDTPIIVDIALHDLLDDEDDVFIELAMTQAQHTTDDVVIASIREKKTNCG